MDDNINSSSDVKKISAQLGANTKVEKLDHLDKQINKLQTTASNHIIVDLIAKYGILILFLFYVWWQTHTIHCFISKEIFLSPDKRLQPSIIITYIKYSLGFNTALILILGYWYGGNGGFSKIMRDVTGSILKKKDKLL